MAEKPKKIVIYNTSTMLECNFNLPENAYVEHFEGWVCVYENNWQSRGSPPIFKYKPTEFEAVMISDQSEDDQLIAKIRTLSKDEMNTLRNIMDSTGLL